MLTYSDSNLRYPELPPVLPVPILQPPELHHLLGGQTMLDTTALKMTRLGLLVAQWAKGGGSSS